MMGAGQRSCFVEIKRMKEALNAEGQPNRNPAALVTWHGAWARVLANKGSEEYVARSPDVQTTITVWFDFYDVMDPLGDGITVSEGMILEIEGFPGSYNITAVHPDFQTKNDVRVEAVKTKLAV